MQWLPPASWLRRYRPVDFTGDLIAGTVVAVMLVPQAMAYAMLAGLPAEVGLYASLLPLGLYAVFGTSRTLAVGPVAIVSLLTADAIGKLGVDPETILVAAITLAALSGLILLVLGIARLGFLVNFISHPVISGFTSAAALVIGFSQLKSVLGLHMPGGINVAETLVYTAKHLSDINIVTMGIAFGAIAILILWPAISAKVLAQTACSEPVQTALTKAGPLVAVVVGTLLVWGLDLQASAEVAIVGAIPEGLPSMTLPSLDWVLLRELLAPAALIAFVGYMESVAVAKSLASKRRQKIDPDQELIALGAANLGASITGGYPVTGGFSRSVVNFTAGANTPIASIVTVVWIVLTVLLLTPLLYFLPRAVLAAVIVVAVATLVDWPAFTKSWRYNKADALALVVTFIAVLVFGVEVGILAGMAISLGLYLLRTSRPHMAVVGRVAATEHFRNIHRHRVQTEPSILAIRIDESLYFANARSLEDYVLSQVADAPEIKHLVLIMSAVNFVDMSALESLESLIDQLRDAGATVHLAEVKGPVMDQFERSDILARLVPGRVFISTHEAFTALAPAAPTTTATTATTEA